MNPDPLAPGPGWKSISSLLTKLAGAGGAPRLTWYGDGGERVELSGAVLVNWVTKSTNLLVEEFDVAPGSKVVLDLPVHWRSAVWALAVWNCGGTVAMRGSGDTSDTQDTNGMIDVVVTDDPARWLAPEGRGRAPELVAVELGALARRFAGNLPPGAVDAASAVMTYSDALGYLPATDPSTPALELRGPGALATGVPAGGVAHGDLLAWSAAARTDDAAVGGQRVVISAPHADPGAVARVLRACLAVWALEGSVVLVDDATRALATHEPARWERLRTGERIDVLLDV